MSNEYFITRGTFPHVPQFLPYFVKKLGTFFNNFFVIVAILFYKFFVWSLRGAFILFRKFTSRIIIFDSSSQLFCRSLCTILLTRRLLCRRAQQAIGVVSLCAVLLFLPNFANFCTIFPICALFFPSLHFFPFCSLFSLLLFFLFARLHCKKLLVTYRLGTGKALTFCYSVQCSS